MKAVSAGIVALALALFVPTAWASPRADMSAMTPSTPIEDFARVVQSVNLAVSDQIWAMPSPSVLDRSPTEAQTALVDWIETSRTLAAAQRRMLTQTATPQDADPRRQAALQAQDAIMHRYLESLELLLEELDYYAASAARLSQHEAWFADAFYDGRTLALRVQHELALSQADLSEDPLAASGLRVLAYSTQVQLELARAAHNRAHASFLNAREIADNLTRAADAMRAALQEAAPLLAERGEDADGWRLALAYEADIADAAMLAAQALRSQTSVSWAGRGAEMNRLVELYRARPARTTSFAMTFTL